MGEIMSNDELINLARKKIDKEIKNLLETLEEKKMQVRILKIQLDALEMHLNKLAKEWLKIGDYK